MIKKNFHRLFYNLISSPKDRNYNLQLLKSNIDHLEFTKNGYVHLKNILSQDIINELLKVYEEIRKNSAYEETNYYVNSVSFKSKEIKKITWEKVKEITMPHLSNVLNIDKLRIPISVGYCINPPNSISGSRLHQDPNLVDEQNAYSIVLWVSLTDADSSNGCLKVIKGSHLWGNSLRSNFHVRWHFDEFVEDILDKNVIDIPTKAGDIICFDPALIHGSGKNKTNKERLAIQISAIPNNETLITVIEENRLFSKAKFYQIDENYFTEESVIQHPSAKYPVVKEQNMNYYYSKESIFKLLNHTNS